MIVDRNILKSMVIKKTCIIIFFRVHNTERKTHLKHFVEGLHVTFKKFIGHKA